MASSISTQTLTNPPITILAIDSGGVYGLSPLLILERLMTELAIHTGDDEARPCDYFDLIVGSGTGGLIAVMLGRLKMSITEAIKEYTQLSRSFFVPKPGPSVLGWSGTPEYLQFDAKKYESELQAFINRAIPHEHPHPNLAQHPEIADQCCGRTLILASRADYADTTPRLFRSYEVHNARADEVPIWKIVRATTATPSIFPPMAIEREHVLYVDPSYSGYSNPSQIGYDEVKAVWPDRRVALLLSLGCGVRSAISLSGGEKEIAESCMRLAKSSSTIVEAMEARFQHEHPRVFFRFSAPSMPDDLEECIEDTAIQRIASLTGGYMNSTGIKNNATQCVRHLYNRVSSLDYSEK